MKDLKIRVKDVVFLIAVIFLIMIAKSMIFVVDRTEIAAVFQFGKPIIGYNGVENAGLKIKRPFPFQNVRFATNKYFLYDSSPKDALTADKKILIVDQFMPALIVDPIRFFTSVKSIAGAQSRIDDTAYSFLGNIIGEETYERIVVSSRDEILDKVTEVTKTAIKDFGLDTPMVRVSQVDLPEQNTKAVFDRMVSERRQEAAKYRAEGNSEKMRISSGADTEAVTIRETARQKAQTILGEADAKAVDLFNTAAAKDPEFFKFYFALDAAKKAFGEGGAKEKTFILNGNESILEPVF